MQDRPALAKPPVGVLYDADFGRDIGQALALCLLYGLDGKNEARVISISVSKPNLHSAATAEVFGRFYAGAVSGAFGAVGRLLPTGMAADGGDPADTPIIKAILEKKNDAGKPVYEHGLRSINDTADPTPLLRNALTGQYDQNCLVILNGPASNLARLLDLPDAKGWIERRARVLVIAGSEGLRADLPAARKVLAGWPSPIVFVTDEVGAALPYPGASVETDFAWSASHPLVDAYRAAGKPMPYDAPGTGMAAVLYAIRGEKEKLFGLSAPGTLQIGADGVVGHAPATDGRHRLIEVDPAKKDLIVKTFVELASAKPVPRAPRFRRVQQEQEKQQQVPPAKPPAAEKKTP